MRAVIVRIAVTVIFALSSAPFAHSAEDAQVGTLSIRVALINKDLEVRAVPKWSFVVRGTAGDELRVNTTFDGMAECQLPVGDYSIGNERPVPFENREFTWNVTFKIAAGERTVLELSTDNANVVEIPEKNEAEVQSSEGRLYQKLKGSVFLIETETGHGSGFLIDTEGLVLTNYHVVANSRYLAVRLAPQNKVPAALVASDATVDVAVIRVSPAAVSSLTALRLAEDAVGVPPVSVGQRVIAIGSPLATENILTAGLVSKVEEGVIHSDIKIAPGNSGGPLFAMSGEVVGINAFRQEQGGDQISGIIRIHKAAAVIAKARQQLAASSEPENRKLPCAADNSFPVDDLRRIASTRNVDLSRYHLEVGPIDVQFVTPIALAWNEIRAEREAAAYRKQRTKRKAGVQDYKPGQDFYEWRRYTGDYKPVVRVQAVPEIGMTGGSIAAVLFLGVNAPVRYKFKTDFDRMELRRDGVVVEPIWPFRVPNVINFQAGTAGMQDVTYFGAYEYPPEAFRPDASIELRIWEQGRRESRVRLVGAEQARLIWNDFAPYFAALSGEVGQAPPASPPERDTKESAALVLGQLHSTERWMTVYEIRLATGLTEGELQRAIEALIASDQIESDESDAAIRYRIRSR